MTAGRRPPTADRRLSGAPGPGCVVQPGGRAVLGLPGGVRWVARHDGYEPPNRFTDELVSLPLHWRHVHEFAAEGAGATRVTDRVETPVPAALLRQTFYYRHAQLAGDLAVHRAMSALQREPMTVAMTGSSGLIGSALTAFTTPAEPTNAGGSRRTPIAVCSMVSTPWCTWPGHPSRGDSPKPVSAASATAA